MALLMPVYDDSAIRPEFDPDLAETGLAEEELRCELTLSLAAKE